MKYLMVITSCIILVLVSVACDGKVTTYETTDITTASTAVTTKTTKPTTEPTHESETVTFPDKNLEVVIRDALDKPSGEITTTELGKLTELEAESSRIRNLSGLEYCTNLTHLNLVVNQISDISPLENLTNLTYLRLDANEISDISSLVANSGLGSKDGVVISSNNLDLTEGSDDMENIRALEDRGVDVFYEW